MAAVLEYFTVNVYWSILGRCMHLSVPLLLICFTNCSIIKEQVSSIFTSYASITLRLEPIIVCLIFCRHIWLRPILVVNDSVKEWWKWYYTYYILCNAVAYMHTRRVHIWKRRLRLTWSKPARMKLIDDNRWFLWDKCFDTFNRTHLVEEVRIERRISSSPTSTFVFSKLLTVHSPVESRHNLK